MFFKKLNLEPLMDEDGQAAGAPTETEQPEEQPQGEKEADGQKTGTDTKSEAQKIADAIVAKKLKNMPTKEELAAFKKWKEDQMSEAEKMAALQKTADDAVKNAEMREAKAAATIAAAMNGIKPEHISDAIILAMAKANDEISVEEAVKQVAANNPTWKVGGAMPNGGSNPAAGANEKIKELKRFF